MVGLSDYHTKTCPGQSLGLLPCSLISCRAHRSSIGTFSQSIPSLFITQWSLNSPLPYHEQCNAVRNSIWNVRRARTPDKSKQSVSTLLHSTSRCASTSSLTSAVSLSNRRKFILSTPTPYPGRSTDTTRYPVHQATSPDTRPANTSGSTATGVCESPQVQLGVNLVVWRGA
jgi:hypothetical protein